MMWSSIPHRLAILLCKIFCILYLRLRVKGIEHIPPEGGFILAGNHVSFLDPVAFGVSCPRLLNYMARDTLFKIPIFGSMIKSFYAFPLKRNSSDIGAIKEALRRLKKGGGLLVFPQGTRGLTREVGEGFVGVGFLARKSGSPVIPAYVKGTNRAMPKGAKFIKPRRIKVIFGESLSFPKDRNTSDKDFTREIIRRINHLKDTH